MADVLKRFTCPKCQPIGRTGFISMCDWHWAEARIEDQIARAMDLHKVRDFKKKFTHLVEMYKINMELPEFFSDQEMVDSRDIT